jgi:PAS domain S-box-containing protein
MRFKSRNALLVIVLACRPFAFASAQSLDISQYAHTTWRVRDGFTKGGILTTAQTPDGYLWLGTEFGLLRFDGVRAIPWQPPTGSQLPSNRILSTLVGRDSTLWIATWKGLASWKDGKLAQYPEVAGQFISPLLEDREGRVWFGTYEPGRLCAIESGKAKCYGAGSFGRGVVALFEDGKGNLWASADGAIWRWTPGPPERYALPRGVEANALIESDSGALLMATNDGLKQLLDGKIRSYPLQGVAGKFRPNSFFRSPDGSLWIGTQQGLLHLHQGRVDKFGAADGLSGDFVNRFLEDREGDIWVTTLDGLDRFREVAIPTLAAEPGLASSTAWSVQATMDGRVWVGTPAGLKRVEGGQATVYPNTAGKNAAKRGLTSPIHSLGLDDRGRLWASTAHGVLYLDGGRLIPVRDAPGGSVFAIAGDGGGKVWILNADAGLLSLSPSGTVERYGGTSFANKFGASALLPDRSRGGVWLGFYHGGISYYEGGKVRTSYTAADGLGKGGVSDLRLDKDSAVWVATEGGLSRVKDGRIATLTSKNGLPCDAVHWIIEDDDGSFWLYLPCGLVQIARSELEAWAQDSARIVRTKIFDNYDGVRTRGTLGGYGPHVTKSPDGRIWFLPGDGVSVIDPRHLPFNKSPPSVLIEQITADDKAYDASSAGAGRMQLPPQVRNLAIDYTALSLAVPEKVRFRFKLEGQDRDWREVINQRRVEYSNLRPGNYRFRVTAANNSGVWNTAGASLDFAMAPAYYQTIWFRALSAAAFLTLLWAAYRLRVRQLRHQEQKLRDVIETIPTFAWTALPDGSVSFVNRTWQEFTGLSSEQSAGSGWQAAVHPSDLERHAEKWRAAVMTGEPLDNEVRYRRAEDGHYRWFWVRAVPLRDGRGKIVNWYGISTDIEDRKLAEHEREALRAEALERANREFEAVLRGRFAERTRIAQELHDTLMQGFAGVALQLKSAELALPERPEDAAATLNRAQQLTHQALREARDSVWDMRTSELDDSDLVDALRSGALAATSGTGTDIEVVTRGERRRLPRALEVVVLRIGREAVANAVKHAEARRIEIALEFGSSTLQLDVRDDGRGVTPEQREQAIRDGHFGITGMQDRARRAGGTCDVLPRNEGGTVVTLRLPLLTTGSPA